MLLELAIELLNKMLGEWASGVDGWIVDTSKTDMTTSTSLLLLEYLRCYKCTFPWLMTGCLAVWAVFLRSLTLHPPWVWEHLCTLDNIFCGHPTPGPAAWMSWYWHSNIYEVVILFGSLERFLLWPLFVMSVKTQFECCLSVFLSLCLCVFVSLCLCVFPSLCLSVSPSFRFSVFLSLCLSVLSLSFSSSLFHHSSS